MMRVRPDKRTSSPIRRLLSLGLIFLATARVALAGEVDLLKGGPVNAATLAEAANHFMAMGEPAAGEALEHIAQTNAVERARSPMEWEAAMEVSHRLGWLCQILWPAKPGSARRPPGFGGLAYFEDRHDVGDWPLLPLAQVGPYYVVLSDSYILAGVPERAEDYLRRCEASGVFRTHKLPVPTRSEAERVLKPLRTSAAWRRVWDGSSGNAVEADAWAFVWRQAESIEANGQHQQSAADKRP